MEGVGDLVDDTAVAYSGCHTAEPTISSLAKVFHAYHLPTPGTILQYFHERMLSLNTSLAQLCIDP